jgi:hypothetical protein
MIQTQSRNPGHSLTQTKNLPWNHMTDIFLSGLAVLGPGQSPTTLNRTQTHNHYQNQSLTQTQTLCHVRYLTQTQSRNPSHSMTQTQSRNPSHSLTQTKKLYWESEHMMDIFHTGLTVLGPGQCPMTLNLSLSHTQIHNHYLDRSLTRTQNLCQVRNLTQTQSRNLSHSLNQTQNLCQDHNLTQTQTQNLSQTPSHCQDRNLTQSLSPYQAHSLTQTHSHCQAPSSTQMQNQNRHSQKNMSKQTSRRNHWAEDGTFGASIVQS